LLEIVGEERVVMLPGAVEGENVDAGGQDVFGGVIALCGGAADEEGEVERVEDAGGAVVVGVEEVDQVDHHALGRVDGGAAGADGRALVAEEGQVVLEDAREELVVPETLQIRGEVLLVVDHSFHRRLHEFHQLLDLRHAE
jgi:hypothetical protein